MEPWSTVTVLQDLLEGRLEQAVGHLISIPEVTYFNDVGILPLFPPNLKSLFNKLDGSGRTKPIFPPIAPLLVKCKHLK